MYFSRQPFHTSAMLRAMADALESHPITEPSFSASPGVVLSTEDDIHGVRMSFSCNVMAEMDEFKETVAEAYKRYSGKPAPFPLAIEANPTSQEH